MTTRSSGLLYVFSSRLIVAAILLLTFAATPTSPAHRRRLGPGGGMMEPPQAVLPYNLPREPLQPLLGQPASVPKSAAFSDQNGNVYLLKTMASWAMARRLPPKPKSLALSKV